MTKKKAVLIAVAVCIIAAALLIFNLNSCSGNGEPLSSSAGSAAAEALSDTEDTAGPEEENVLSGSSETGSGSGKKKNGSEEKDKKDTCLITINDGAASANTTEAVNGLHVYDPNSEELDDYFSGMEVQKGTTVDIFAYNLASPVSLEIEHDGKTIAERTYSVMEAWTDDDLVEHFEFRLEGDLVVTTEALPANTKSGSEISVNNESLGQAFIGERDIHDGDLFRNGTYDLTLKYAGYDVNAVITVDGEEAGSAKLSAAKKEAVTKNTDYTVRYTSNKNVGTAGITVTGKGAYTGTRKLRFKILPEGMDLTSLNPGKNRFTAKWKKQAVQTSGYELWYSTKKDMSGSKKYRISSNKILSGTRTGLTGGQTYYVQVRTYRTVGGKNYYSAWSGKAGVKVKKVS